MTAELAWLLAGFALDLLWGDPRWLPHPVRGFGKAAAFLERLWRRVEGLAGGRAAGTGFALTATGFATAFVAAALAAAGLFPWLSSLVAVYWVYSLLAVRDLDVETRAVILALENGDLAEARRALSFIVGRDTGGLDRREILRAVHETIAESLSDGIVAPLLYFGLAGPAGMAAYKAVNTLDSMAGYRNAAYRDFGWAPARLDDLANLVPARLTALLIVAAAAMSPRLDARRAWRAVRRDARSQPSPNAGYPEAALAGALGVRLGGLNFYEGLPGPKAALGDPAVDLSVQTYESARKLIYATAVLGLAAAALLVWLRTGLS